ncbi:MAG: hypothetical protein K2X82_31405 [Gemmataceae bacterium]|nr:hypothetical protein [Gemmataceae bacterium]
MTATADAPAGLFELIYPTARVRGRLVRRDTGGTLRWATLGAAKAEELGRDGVGWFVGRHPGTVDANAQLGRLDANPEGGIWVVVPFSYDLSDRLRAAWPHPESVTAGPDRGVWQSRKVWVAPPEQLRGIRTDARDHPDRVAGVIILDPGCLLYRSRGGVDRWGHAHTNDRPQHVTNFREDLTTDGWQPPLLLLTDRPPLGVDAAVAARAFGLEAWEFVAGDSFACWEVPIEADD